jgi:hypothetical protein
VRSAELPPAAPAPPLPRTLVDDEPPYGHVATAAVPAPATRRPPRIEESLEEPSLEDAVPVPPPPPEPEPPPEDEGVLERPPPGAPRVQLSFLVYSSVPARRTVLLSVGGAGLVSLHEGESTGGVVVQRIFANRIHVRHGGDVFVVHPRD